MAQLNPEKIKTSAVPDNRSAISLILAQFCAALLIFALLLHLFL